MDWLVETHRIPFFLRTDVEEDAAELPTRLYAYVNHENPRDEWVFDAVDARWFDGGTPGRRGWLTEPDRAPDAGDRVSIVRVPRNAVPARDPVKGWWALSLEPGRALAAGEAAATAIQHLTLYGAGIPRQLRDVQPVSAHVAARLGAAGSMSTVRDGDPREISALLSRGDEADAVAVYDVGQGSANAVIRRGRPSLVFDLGGGVTSHRQTFPAQRFTAFCFRERPPIVLSHWDWDHWSSAGRFPSAFAQTWIVPRQGSLRPTHALFLATLRRLGRVLVWPRNRRKLRSASATIHVQRCSGPPSNINASGLAMIVRPKDAAPILLPGDARYQYMSVPEALRAVVATHHGGPIGTSVVPHSDGSRGAVVFSFGDGNSYGHPRADVRAAHQREFPRVRETPEIRPELGHVQLRWDAAGPASPACGGTACSLLARRS